MLRRSLPVNHGANSTTPYRGYREYKQGKKHCKYWHARMMMVAVGSMIMGVCYGSEALTYLAMLGGAVPRRPGRGGGSNGDP